MKEIDLPSGAKLKITLAPFADAKALYQAVLEEFKQIEFNSHVDMSNLFKNIACYGFSSRKIEYCLENCFKRCTYNSGKGDLKIDKDSFESVESRGDYIHICIAIAEENIAPFLKSLFAQYEHFLATIQNVLESKQKIANS